MMTRRKRGERSPVLMLATPFNFFAAKEMFTRPYTGRYAGKW